MIMKNKCLFMKEKLEDGRGRANYGLEVCKQYNFQLNFLK